MTKSDYDKIVEMFGEPISVYTSDDAEEDGVLVNVWKPGFYVTRAVFEAAEAKDDGRTIEQKLVPLMMDAAMLAMGKRFRPGSDERETLWTDGLEGNVTGRKVWVGANEKGGLTVMFPEDY